MNKKVGSSWRKRFRLQPSIAIRQRSAIRPSRFFLAWDAVEDDPVIRQNLKMRSALMIEIEKAIRQQQLTQAEAAGILGVSQPRVSALLKGKINDFRLDTLVNFAHKMGLQVLIQVGHGNDFPRGGEVNRIMRRAPTATTSTNKEKAMTQPSPTYTDEPFVFVCYAHADADLVHAEIGWLQEQGLKFWYDEPSRGEIRPEDIANAIEGAVKVLFYISKSSQESDNCRREITYSLDKGIEIVRVFLEEVELDGDLQTGLNLVQTLHPHRDTGYRQHLLKALGENRS